MIALLVISGKYLIAAFFVSLFLWVIQIRYGNVDDLNHDSKIIRFLRRGR